MMQALVFRVNRIVDPCPLRNRCHMLLRVNVYVKAVTVFLSEFTL